jgi:putative PIN family toxin of toxin-antitoxin system
VIVDTNVLVSGLLWRGPPHAVLEQIRSGALKFVSSPALLAEFAEVIRRPKFASILSRAGIEPADLVAKVRELAEVTDPPPLLVPVCRDPDDDALLALAVAAQADLIISGDADLLALGSYSGISVINPTTAVAKIGC